MFGAVFVFVLVAVATVLVTRDAMSMAQIGVQIGEIHNNGTGGGNFIAPNDETSNSSSTVPGSGYPGGYYANNSNESTPTSPSMSGGSLNLQNSSIAPFGCDCSQASNVQEIASTNASPTTSSSDSSNDATTVTSDGVSSRK